MKHQILVVDDSSSDVELLLVVLRSLCSSLDIFVAYDGQEALDILIPAGDHPERPVTTFSLVLLDIKMPRVDGFEVLSALKSHSSAKLVPVVMFTSSSEEKDVEMSYRFGANGYAVKPVDFQDYQELLNGIVGYWLGANRTASEGQNSSVHADVHPSSGVRVVECRTLNGSACRGGTTSAGRAP